MNSSILDSYRKAYADGVKTIVFLNGIQLNLKSLIESLENYCCPICELKK